MPSTLFHRGHSGADLWRHQGQQRWPVLSHGIQHRRLQGWCHPIMHNGGPVTPPPGISSLCVPNRLIFPQLQAVFQGSMVNADIEAGTQACEGAKQVHILPDKAKESSGVDLLLRLCNAAHAAIVRDLDQVHRRIFDRPHGTRRCSEVLSLHKRQLAFLGVIHVSTFHEKNSDIHLLAVHRRWGSALT